MTASFEMFTVVIGLLVLFILQLGLFLAGALAGGAISLIIFSLVGNHFGPHAFIIRYRNTLHFKSSYIYITFM